MRKMSWDDELATVAQRWASQCLFAHDSCHKVDRFPNVGQNIFQFSSSSSGGAAPWPAAINSWYNETALFNKSNVNPFVFSLSTNHYTQIVWANNSLVGCGYSYFKDTGNSMYKKLMVCNYGPGGNSMGLDNGMYLVGTPCSRCDLYPKTKCERSLCK